MEFSRSKCGKYHVECLSAKTFPGAIEIIKDHFCQDEPVCIGAEIDKNPKAAEELLELCADAALDGVSLVAVENNTREVVSVSFNKLQVPLTEKTYFEEFVQERCTQESSKSTMEFLIVVDGRCNLFEKYNADCSLELMYLTTHRDHRQKGLGELVIKDSIELAKRLKDGPITKVTVKDLGSKYVHLKDRPVCERPPKICQAIFSSFISQKIGAKLDFNVELRIPYEEFIFNGKTYAERIGLSSPFSELICIHCIIILLLLYPFHSKLYFVATILKIPV